MTSNIRYPRSEGHLSVGIAGAFLALALSQGASASPTGPDTLATLDQIRQWNQVGRSADAERHARAGLKAAELAHGTESAEAADYLDELAVALRRGGKGSDPEAMEVCKRSLRIKEKAFGAASLPYAKSLYNIGLLDLIRKNYKDAETALKDALDLRRKSLGTNHPDVAKCLLALGSVYYETGNYSEGLSLTEQAVAIERATLGAENPERAQGLNALAAIRYSSGDFSGAISLFEEAIGLWERSSTPNREVVASAYHNLGALYVEMGDYESSISALKKALKMREDVYGSDHPFVAATLGVLGSAAQHTGDLKGARQGYERAVRILESGGPDDPDLGWYRSKLGWVYLEGGDLVRANNSFAQSLRELKGTLGPDHPDLWMPLRGLAMIARRRGETAVADSYYVRTLDLLRQSSGPRHPDSRRTLAEYASFKLSVHDSMGALDTALAAADVNREHLRLTVQGVPERQALLYTSSMETGLDIALASMTGAAGSRPDNVRRVWDALVRSRAMVLDEVAERTRLIGGAGEILQGANTLEVARGRLANILVRSSSGEAFEQDSAMVANARQEVERAEQNLALRSAAFRRERDRAALGWNQVLAALPESAALVSYVGYGEAQDRAYLALVMGTDRRPRAVPLGPAEEIERLIARWRTLVGTQPTGGSKGEAASEAACRKAGEAVRSRIWDPFAAALAGSNLVLVVPDGPLHLLDLAALPYSKDGYLVESPFAIHYLSAERDVASAEAIPTRGNGLLAVGGPSFDAVESPRSSASAGVVKGPPASSATGDTYRDALFDCEGARSLRFEPLPETLREIDEITKAWGRPEEVVVLEEQSAGEGTVKELLPGKRVAHFATHGFFLDASCPQRGNEPFPSRGIGGLTSAGSPPPANRVRANPLLLSGLALTGANRHDSAGAGEEDGILTAEEIASLNLTGLEWAVLSACDTGVGSIQAGEGVLGLRRAFEIAGAGTLILSLWPVEDRSARNWMSRLYDSRFRKNLQTAEAVQAADVGVLRDLRAAGKSTHPFYWGGFVATGNWR